jgi:CheY-like chemotaxis protein
VEQKGSTDKTTQERQPIDTVLVVDDDDNWCYLSKRILQKAGVGKQVLTAQNGLEAITKLRTLASGGEKLPELVFLDIKMPVMDGFEFLDEIVKSTDLNLSHTRIFMCSSSFHFKDRERANQYPVAGFITKPLTPEVLKNILN